MNSDQLTALLAAHGIHLGGWATLLIWHFWPQVRAWALTTGTDEFVMAGWREFKTLLKNAGASDDEIRQIENIAAQVALRAAQDIQKNAPPSAKA